MDLLEMSGIRKAFSGVIVLNGVDLHVARGEIHALLGENGAGKSTLMNILTGSYTADAGTVTFDGADITGASIKAVEKAGIAFVHQELNLFNDLLAYENIFLGQEETGPVFSLKKRSMIEKARELFERLGVDIDPTALVADLKQSQKQLLEISRALFFNAKLLILDEPTTALNTAEVEHLFQIVRSLRDQGTSFIFISHKMPEIFELCDTYTVLRNGTFVGEGKIADTTPREVTGMMVGAAISERGAWEPRPAGETVLELDHYSGPGFSDISLKVSRGQVIGLTGLLGSGRSELARAIYGADRAQTGTLKVKGQEVKIHHPIDAMHLGMGMLPDDRKAEGIIGDLSVRENIILAMQAKRGILDLIPMKEQEEIADKFIDLLQIKCASRETPVKQLSGGNQQKVIIARWLATDPDFLILDEPTRGIDIGTKTEIQKLVIQLAQEGKGVLFISSEIEEMLRTCNRLAVLRDGAKVGELSGDMTQEKVMKTIAEG